MHRNTNIYTYTHNNLSSLLRLTEEFINNFNRIFSYIIFFYFRMKCETGSFILCRRRFCTNTFFFGIRLCVASTQKRNFMHSAISYFIFPWVWLALTYFHPDGSILMLIEFHKKNCAAISGWEINHCKFSWTGAIYSQLLLLSFFIQKNKI